MITILLSYELSTIWLSYVAHLAVYIISSPKEIWPGHQNTLKNTCLRIFLTPMVTHIKVFEIGDVTVKIFLRLKYFCSFVALGPGCVNSKNRQRICIKLGKSWAQGNETYKMLTHPNFPPCPKTISLTLSLIIIVYFKKVTQLVSN